jgi:hypothetical protein
MKLNHHEYKKNYQDYIINNIDSDSYDIKTNSDKDKINFFINVFNKEYDFEIARIGKYKALASYLSGLPSSINLPIYNYDILEFSKKMGSVDSDLSENQENKIINNYYNFMSNIIFSIHEKLNK